MVSILIAEDDQHLREMLEEAFASDPDFKVTSVAHGMDASRFLKRGDFDLFLIDYKMPWVDGEELFSRIRKIDKYLSTPVFIMTGHAGELSPDILCDEQVSVIDKPFSIDEMMKNIKDEALNIKKEKSESKESKIDITMIDTFTKTTEAVLRHVSGFDGIEASRPYVHRPDQSLGMDMNDFLYFESQVLTGVLGLMYRRDAFLWLASVLGSQSYATLEKAVPQCGQLPKRIQKTMWSKLGIAQRESAHRQFEFRHHLGDRLQLDTTIQAPTIVIPMQTNFGECSAVLKAKRFITEESN